MNEYRTYVPKYPRRKPRDVAPRRKTTRGLEEPMSVKDAARALHLRYLVTLRLIQSGKVPGVRVRKRYFVERREVERALREEPWTPWATRRCDR